MLVKTLSALLLAAGVIATPVRRASTAPTFNYAGDPPYPDTPAQMSTYVTCPSTFAAGQVTIVLFPGTGSTGPESWGAYQRTLAEDGFSNVCIVSLPNRTLGDAQDSGARAAYVMHYVSYLNKNSSISVIGHSQGNLNIQWALTFWPSTRASNQGPVNQFISLAGDFHGTAEGPLVCTAEEIGEGGCVPSVLQQTVGSKFLAALAKHGGTSALTNTTSLYTIEDDVIQPENPPALATSRLTGSPLYLTAIQVPCPATFADHFLMLVNGPAYTIAKDALTHGGVANPARFPANLCATMTDTSTSEVSFLEDILDDIVAVATGDGVTLLRVEPPIKSYAM